MFRRIILFLSLFICLVSVGNCADNGIWTLYSHNELVQGESFAVNDYAITLVTVETNTSSGGYTLLVQYKNDKSGDVGSKYLSLNEALYFDNNTCMVDYPNEFIGKHFLNAYTLDKPKISMIALFNRRYDNDTIEINISMKNDGMTATDITTKIVLPDNYDVPETTLFDDETLNKFESMQGTVQLEQERGGMAHFELDTTYKFVNPATNETQEQSFVRTIDIFENNTTLVQECSLDDDEVYDRYSFLARNGNRSDSTSVEESTNTGETIVATNVSETVTPTTEIIVPNEGEESVVTPTEVPVEVVETPVEVPTTPPPVEVINNPVPVEVSTQESPKDNKMIQVAAIVAITLFGIFSIMKPAKRKQKQEKQAMQLAQPPIDITKDPLPQGNQIDPDTLDVDEEEEENTFSWTRNSD